MFGPALKIWKIKVPVRVLYVENKSVRLLNGTYLGKPTEVTTEIKQEGNGEEKDATILGGHYSVNSYMYTDIPSHPAKFIGTSSIGMTSMQCQRLKVNYSEDMRMCFQKRNLSCYNYCDQTSDRYRKLMPNQPGSLHAEPLSRSYQRKLRTYRSS